MSSDNEELYLQKLHEFILDEDKIVTFSWLSRELNIDVKLAKSLLGTFVADHRTSKPEELGVCYILLGVLKENGLLGVMTVKEKELEEKKGLFEMVASESIYSIQKSENVDFSMISMVDMFDVQCPTDKPRLGSIVGKNCVKRNLKVKKALPEVSRTAPTDKSKATHLFSSSSKIKSEEKQEKVEAPKTNGTADIKKNGTTKKSPPKDDKKNKTKINPKGGIASFFSKAPPKKETNQQKEIKEEKQSPKQETKSDFAKKHEEVKVKSTEKEEVNEESMDVDDDDEPVTKKSKKNTLYDSDTDEEAKKIEQTNKKQGGNSSAKKKKGSVKRKNEESLNKVEKKRKRFVVRNDSDSDDIFGDDKEEEEDVIESDDEPVYKKPAVTQLAPKNKQRKFVNKTYTDEEGFIVTVKETVYVSGSEEEEEKEQKDPQIVEKPVKEVPKLKKESSNEISPTKGVKGKKAAKVAANQPKLTNFFKKS